MTLTGGLWFGVSRVPDLPYFQLALLFLAFAGNTALCFIILRLRYVMERHLNWLETCYPSGFVAARGTRWYNRPFLVRTLFQSMLGLAAALSLVLFCATLWKNRSEVLGIMPQKPAIAYYDTHATSLADGYETVTFEQAHPDLVQIIAMERAGQPLTVLDIGAGTGRDAAWFAARGHNVLALEPSGAMRAIGAKLHVGESIVWRDDALPELTQVMQAGKTFDIIVISAVWMHLAREERATALSNVYDLLAPGGTAYLTLRLGPAEPSRGIYDVTLADFKALAQSLSLPVTVLRTQPDLLGRSHISWQALRIDKPAP